MLRHGKVYIFNSCKINSENREEKYVSSMPIGIVVRASCSYPFVFSPCEYSGKEFLDGGIKENLPWKELKRIGCDKILSINFYNSHKKKCCDNVIEIAERSFELMCDELNKYELENIEFLHTIKLNNVSLLEMEKMDEVYEEGYKQTKNRMKQIKEYLVTFNK